MIKNLPIHERPREKLIQYGPGKMGDAELLAILLRTGTRGKSAISLAQDVIQHCGGLHQLLHTNADVFCQIPGVHLAAFAQIKAALELGRRASVAACPPGHVIQYSHEAVQLLRQHFDDQQEQLYAIFLNSKNGFIAIEQLAHGTINGVDFHPRHLVTRALHYRAAAIILAHNHPSGDCTPSTADLSLTRATRQLLQQLDVQLVDHLIITPTQHHSLLPPAKTEQTKPQVIMQHKG